MEMDVLDHPLDDYDWVIRHGFAVRQAIADWHRDALGHEVSVGGMEHILWRAGKEHDRLPRPSSNESRRNKQREKQHVRLRAGGDSGERARKPRVAGPPSGFPRGEHRGEKQGNGDRFGKEFLLEMNRVGKERVEPAGGRAARRLSQNREMADSAGVDPAGRIVGTGVVASARAGAFGLRRQRAEQSREQHREALEPPRAHR